MIRCTAFVFALAVTLVSGVHGDDDASKSARENRETKFKEQLTGAVMEGSFTIDGKSNDGPPPRDKYTIDSVAKIQEGKWLITARIEYMKVDVKVPVPVEVKWAGDTPVIMLTDVSLPGMTGTFSTRLLVDGDRYAGTWSHDKVGGHMWGRIKKSSSGNEKSADSSGSQTPKTGTAKVEADKN
jgi:hypothetical protein